eukprot:426373_1
MGNIVPKSTAASASQNSVKINIDDIDLEAIDESKSHEKENKKTRKSKEYKQLRVLARSGIDAPRRFELWRKATNALDKYNKMYNIISEELFEDIDMNEFPQFPRFGSACKFERLLPENNNNNNDNDNEEKKNENNCSNLLHSSQRILLILAMEHDSLKYCPQLGYLVEEMLLDINTSENAVFSICNSMLIASKRNNWYFRTDYFNSYIRIQTFLSIFEDNVSFVASYLKNNSLDISNMLGDAISSMWFEYLNTDTYLRLIDTFTVEGYKILFRVGVALLNHAQSQLILCKDLIKFKNILIIESKKLKPNELCQRCFKIYLTRNKFDKLDKFHRNKGFENKMLNKIEEETYVRRWPSFDVEIMNKSNILTKKIQFLQLWVWLPPGCHIGEYKLLFSTQNDGYKLSQLYLNCQQENNIIIIIKTVKKDIFGCFCTQLNDPMDIDSYPPLKKRIKDPKILLFQLYLNNNNDFKPKCFYANTADQFYHKSNFQLKNMHSNPKLLNTNEIENDFVEIVSEENKNNNNNNNENENENEQRVPVVFPSKDSLIIGD